MKKGGEMIGAVAGACAGAIGVSVILAAVVFSFFAGQRGVWLALSAVAFFSSLALVLMALRKFGNNEAQAGSLLVRKSNLFGFAGFLFLSAAMAVALGGWEGGGLVVAVALVFAWLYWFGKRSMRYW